MTKILVIGSKGQLGNEFQVLATKYTDFQFYFFDKEELDITIQDEVEKCIAALQPDYLINCAAYTAVDKAETDQATAFAINADAVGYLAKACQKHTIRFFHISTDYVFDGKASSPYQEDDEVQPSNVYGLSKLEGERKASAHKETIIIRTAWVYSAFGNNFVKTMLRLMGSKPEINVVSDQHGSPTYAADLAEAILQIIQSGKWVPGVYHFTNEGSITWFDFATEIKNLSRLNCIINPIKTEQYPTPAKRPQYSVLDKTKFQQTFNLPLKDWKQSLQNCLQAMQLQ